ncbi:heme utilization cystosolic carrier protein HutX [Gallibacterium trehalosifermentans]|uniref:Heme utilization cystosolic carrier protein HutX n=1 Tax=Gallibacterium trehalosifermentans TaxID=516935 RepID=A0ABV6H556_9PAST
MLLKQQIEKYLNEKPSLSTQELAKQLDKAEGEIILVLPENMLSIIDGSYSEQILNELPQWGQVTTIIEKAGSIFEIKETFPIGKSAYGYYNLNLGQESQGVFYGHLKLDQVKYIALVSKPLRGKATHAIIFISEQKQVIFKIYLGRNEQGEIFPDQLERFKQLTQFISHSQ